MALGFEAGKVYVRVVPDASDFNEKLRRPLRRAKEEAERLMRIQVVPELDRTALNRVKAQLRGLDATAHVKVKADTDKLKEELRKASDAPEVKVEPVLDAQKLKERIKHATHDDEPTVKIKPELDKSLFDQQFKQLNDSLKFDGKSMRFNPEFLTRAREEWVGTSERIHELVDKNIDDVHRLQRETGEALRNAIRDYENMIARSHAPRGRGNDFDHEAENVRRVNQELERQNSLTGRLLNLNRRLSQDRTSRSWDRANTRHVEDQVKALENLKKKLGEIEGAQKLFNRRPSALKDLKFDNGAKSMTRFKSEMERANDALRRQQRLLEKLANEHRNAGGVLMARKFAEQAELIGKQLEYAERKQKLFNKTAAEAFKGNFSDEPFSRLNRSQDDALRKLRENIDQAKRLRRELSHAYFDAATEGNDEHARAFQNQSRKVTDALKQMRREYDQLAEIRRKLTDTSVADKLKADFDVSHLRDSVRRLKQEIENSDTGKVRLRTELDTERARQLLDRLRNRELTRTLRMEVDVDTQRAEQKLDDLEEDRETTVNADADTGRARYKLAKLTRPRHVLIIPKIDKAATAKVLTVLAALSGARATWEFTKNFTDFVKDLDKNLTQLIKLAAVISTVTAGITSLTGHVFALGQSLLGIFPSVLALPGIFTGIGIAALTTGFALKQWKDRMKDVDDRLKAAQDRASDRFWEKFEGPIRHLVDTLYPQWDAAIQRIGTHMGQFFANATTAAERYLATGGFDSIFNAVAEGLDRMGAGMDPFIEGLLRFIDIGAQFFPRFGDWFTDMANRFNDWTQKADVSGAIERGIFALKEFWRAGVAAWGILAEIAKAATEAGSATVTTFADMLERMRNGLATFESQWTMTTLFRGANEALLALGPSFDYIGKALYNTAETITVVMKGISEIINSWVKLITEAVSTLDAQSGIQKAVEGVSKGMEELSKHSAPLGVIIGALGSVIGVLGETILPLFGTALEVLAPMFENLGKAAEAVIPVLGTWFRDAITWLHENVGPLVEQFSQWVQENPELASSILLIAGAIAGVIAVIGPVVTSIGGFIGGLVGLFEGAGAVIAAFSAEGALAGAASAAGAAAGPIAIVIAAILAIAGAFVYVYNTSEEFRKGIEDMLSKIDEIARPIVDTFNNDLRPALEDFGKSVQNAFKSIADSLQPWFEIVIAVVNGILTVLKPVMEFITAVFGPLIGEAIRGLGLVFELVFGAIGNVIYTAGQAIKSGFKLITGDVKGAYEEVQKIGKRWEDWWKELWPRLSKFLTDTLDKMIESAVETFGRLTGQPREKIEEFKNFAKEALKNMVESIGKWLGELPGVATNNLNSMVSSLRNFNLQAAGRALINGFFRGVQAAFSGGINMVKNSLSHLRGLFPHSPAKWGPFSGSGYTTHSGKALMRDFAKGMASEEARVAETAARSLSKAKDAFDNVHLSGGYDTSAVVQQRTEVSLADGKIELANNLGEAVVDALRSGVELKLDPRTNTAVMWMNETGARETRRSF